MGFATTATAILPTYHAIGIGAPALLLFMRVLQGFSVGGEYMGSVTYLVETAPDEHRGLAGSIANIGATVGLLLASGVATATVMLTNSVGGAALVLAHSIRVWRYHRNCRLYSAASSARLWVYAERVGASFFAAARSHCRGTSCDALRALVHLRIRHCQLSDDGVPANLRRYVRRRNRAARASGQRGGAGLGPFCRAASCMADGSGRAAPDIADNCLLCEFIVAWSGIALAWRGGIAGVWTAQLGFRVPAGAYHGRRAGHIGRAVPQQIPLKRLFRVFQSRDRSCGRYGAHARHGADRHDRKSMAPAWYLMLGSAVAAGAAFLMADRSGQPLR